MTSYPDYLDANWSLVPHHLRDGLRGYIEQGQRPGGFLEAVLSNNLVQTALRADALSLRELPNVLRFLLNYAPGESHGSAACVKEWMAKGGLGIPSNVRLATSTPDIDEREPMPAPWMGG